MPTSMSEPNRDRVGQAAARSPGPPSDQEPASGASDPRERLERLRTSILECDQTLIRVLRRRCDLVHDIGREKLRLGLPVTDPRREAVVVRRAAQLAREAGLDEEMVRNLIWQIMSSARTQQHGEGQADNDTPDPA